MQVDVVVSQSLLDGQAGADAAVGRLGDAGLVEAERRQQRAQPRDLVLVGRGHVLEPPARGRGRASGLRRSARIAAASEAEMLGQQRRAARASRPAPGAARETAREFRR